MNIRPLRTVVAGFSLALAAMMSACATASESAPEGEAIVAVGDIHGDWDAYMAILRNAGLVNAKGKWSGGRTILVQLGDIPDRGGDTKKIIEHLMKLEKEAKKKGGRVVPLIGNHEAMNVIGDLRYVSAPEYAAFTTSKSKALRETYFKQNFAALAEFYRKKDPSLDDAGVKAAYEKDVPLGYLEHRIAWGPKGKFGAWIASHDAVLKIGDTLFAHGGLSAAYAARPLLDINEEVRAALAAGSGLILEDEQGPLWHRGLAEEKPAGEADVAAALAAYSAKRIVIGHTPQLQGVKSLYGGRVIAADTGASKAYGGTRSFVRIDSGGVAANDNGVERRIEGGVK